MESSKHFPGLGYMFIALKFFSFTGEKSGERAGERQPGQQRPEAQIVGFRRAHYGSRGAVSPHGRLKERFGVQTGQSALHSAADAGHQTAW